MTSLREVYPILFVHGYLFFLWLMGAMDMGVFQTGSVKPALFMIGLYTVLLLRPAVMPQLAVLIYGLGYDFLYGMPVGLYAFLSLFVTLIINNGRRYLQGQSWPVIWSGFILTYSAVLLVEIIFFWFVRDVPLDGSGLAGRLVMSAVSFPLFFLPFLWIERWLKSHD
jgi:rod shape-determining protein MreD